ncbi:MAG: Na+/H+ antiporter subunit [Sphingomonas bacterium]|nr:Na+/H+ antiporter subunit G [Sphingomonas bacterium]MDB5689709.1 Na+/H+ antiporter subunit [Sphingomonas bacterium]
MSGVADLLASALILIGAGFVLIGSWGLVRLPTILERLHAPTKATTLGLGALLIAAMLFSRLRLGVWTVHELLIPLFLFLTAPISANMIAKVHLHRQRTGAEGDRPGLAGSPPPPDDEGDWATFAAPEEGASRLPAGD